MDEELKARIGPALGKIASGLYVATARVDGDGASTDPSRTPRVLCTQAAMQRLCASPLVSADRGR